MSEVPLVSIDDLNRLTLEDLLASERDLATRLLAMRGEIDRRHNLLLARDDRNKPRLTLRQKQCLEGICRGLLNKEISAELNITYRCVKHHVTLVFRKYGVQSRSALLTALGGNKP